MAKDKKQRRKMGPKESPMEFNPPLNPLEMQKLMAQAMATLLGDESFSEETEAARILDKAFRARSPKQAEKLARQALQLDPHEIGAYELLAELAASPEEAIGRLETGLREVEAHLGKKMFRENAGHFWGIHETRPYMRLRQELASRLWHSGRRDEAIVHFQEMLRLNPNDNQGVRDILAGWLLEERRLDEAEELLQRYREDSTAMQYSRALLAFCREGASQQACLALREAEESNEFLARYLAGADVILPEQPEYYSPGDEREGMIFARYYLPAWRSTPGALAWLRKTLQLADHPDAAYLGPEELELAIAALPQRAEEVWEIEARQLDEEMEVDGEYCRPWVFAAVDAADPSNLIQIGCSPVEYSIEEILDLVGESMLNPVIGEPRRPGKLLLSSSPLAKDLYKKLKKLKVRCEYRPDLEGVDHLFSQRLDFLRQFLKGFQDAPTDLDLDDLRDLPQSADEVWQMDSRHLPVLLGNGDEAASPTLLLIVDAEENLVPAMELQSDPTKAFQPDQTLLKAISFPMVGEPRRPAVVQVRTEQIANALRKTLDALDIGLEVTKNLDQWDEAFAMLSQKIGGDGQQRPALVELPGATPEQVAGIFDAAAGFYRAAPWRLVLGDSIIRVECPEFASAPWFACVMGQMGETLGVALYEDERYIRDLLRERDLDPEQSMRSCSSLVIMYGEKHEAAPQDVASVQKQRLPLAAPEAYPTFIRVKPGIAIQMPLLWEAKFMEAALRAIPTYLQQRARGRQTITVTAFGKPAAVTLELIS